jgi:enhancer of mRNA-decapping protein 3
MIHANEIVELVEAGDENIVPIGRPALKATPVSQGEGAFEDPAILSVGKRPTPGGIDSRPGLPKPWSDVDNHSMRRGDSARTAATSTRDREERPYQDPVALAAAAMRESLQNMALGEDDEDEDVIPDAGEGLIVDEPGEIGLDAAAGKGEGGSRNRDYKARRQNRREGRRNVEKSSQDPAPVPSNGPGPGSAKTTKRAKGWRQTPLLTESFQPFSTLTRKNGRRNRKMEENGWGTEDATDVQDMGDFDFERSLAKFDKHTVFNQIQAEDSVADEDRLVYHNRLPKAKPGTAGGKNLHYTENVLDGPPNGGSSKHNDAWKSEAGESEAEERMSQRGSGSGRPSRRAESKLSTNRRPISRKGSSTQNSGQPRITSVSNLKYPQVIASTNCI